MAKKEKTTIKEWLVSNSLQLTLQVIGLFMVILNLWIVTKLAPITQDLAIVSSRVDAIEDGVVPREELDARLDDVRSRLIRIETLLDSHDR